jgi:hypothetical protein
LGAQDQQAGFGNTLRIVASTAMTLDVFVQGIAYVVL